MKSAPAVTVVVISRDEGKELRLTVENLDDTLPASGEIVIVDDGSTDRSADKVRLRRGRIKLKRVKNYGVARARNLGARLGRGDIVVFADAHIRLDRDWWKPLAEILENKKMGGAAPGVGDMAPGRQIGYGLKFKGPSLEAGWLTAKGTAPFAAPILTGCCFAMRRDVFEATGGWDEGLLGRGGVDNEGCVRLWLLGYDLMVAPEVVVRHLFRKVSPYHVAWPQFLHNRLRLAYAHFNPKRIADVVLAQKDHPGFGEALLLVAEREIAAFRASLLKRRKRDDDWFFERFKMQW